LATPLSLAYGVVALVGDDEAVVSRLLEVVPSAMANSLIVSSIASFARVSPMEALARAQDCRPEPT